VRKGESAKLQLKRLDGSTVVKPVATYLVMPMATQRPQNLLPREQAVVVGEMVLFQTEDAGHFAIEKIIAVDGDRLADVDAGWSVEAQGTEAMPAMHEFEPGKSAGTTSMPLWIKEKKRERKADKLVGFTAEVIEVAVSKLVCSTELDGNWKLTEADIGIHSVNHLIRKLYGGIGIQR
jgi:hypothetical protein